MVQASSTTKFIGMPNNSKIVDKGTNFGRGLVDPIVRGEVL